MECERCGSTTFQIDSGIRYCSNGHEQEGGQQIGEDEADYGTQGRIVRKAKEPPREKVSKVYRRKRAYRLFLQAYQLLIWKQCYALIHEKELPEELWGVVRDLWTLRLGKLLDRFDDGGEVGQSVSVDLENASESQGEGLSKSRPRAGAAPVLLQTICLCYMGILLLRQPVSLAQLFRWIREEDIPYFRALRHIPNEMIEKLPGEYCDALDTSSILKREDLQYGVYQLCNLYRSSFSISISPINWKILLFAYIKELALPLEIYAAVKHLNKILNFTFSHLKLSSARRKITSYPEAQLMSLVVIAVKLIHPFDSTTIPRYPHSSHEPAAVAIDWTPWLVIQQKDPPSSPALQKGSEISIKDTDIFSLSPTELDTYMDWYQRTWITSSARTQEDDDHVSREILNMFPLQHHTYKFNPINSENHEEQVTYELVKTSQSQMTPCDVIADDDAMAEVERPGTSYAQFRTIEALRGQAQAAAYTFHEIAAETACLGLDGLLRAVLQTERRIVLWRKAKRRAEVFGGEMDVDAEGGMVYHLQGMQLDELTERPTGTQSDEEFDQEGSDGDVDTTYDAQ